LAVRIERLIGVLLHKLDHISVAQSLKRDPSDAALAVKLWQERA
jgi:hypothetical protein